MKRLLAITCLLVTSCPAAPPSHVLPPELIPLPKAVRGANLREVGDLQHGYGSRTARRTMERLRALGVNTIGVLLEGQLDDLDDPEIEGPDREAMAGARRVLLDANALGLATVLIPHLVLADGKWRGEVHFDDNARAEQFWRSYDAFIGRAATIASESSASVLSLGVELKAMSKEPATAEHMRALASRVRRDYRGLLTYSANWDEAEDVRFWDAVDVAGVNGYYPLLPEPQRGAEAIARRLSSLALIADKEVIVLEVGYRAGPLPHVEPWTWPEHVEPAVVDETAQAQAWAAVLSEWLTADHVRGLMVWVIPTDPDDPASEPRHGFNPLNKPAETVIGRAFRGSSG